MACKKKLLFFSFLMLTITWDVSITIKSPYGNNNNETNQQSKKENKKDTSQSEKTATWQDKALRLIKDNQKVLKWIGLGLLAGGAGTFAYKGVFGSGVKNNSGLAGGNSTGSATGTGNQTATGGLAGQTPSLLNQNQQNTSTNTNQNTSGTNQNTPDKTQQTAGQSNIVNNSKPLFLINMENNVLKNFKDGSIEKKNGAEMLNLINTAYAKECTEKEKKNIIFQLLFTRAINEVYVKFAPYLNYKDAIALFNKHFNINEKIIKPVRDIFNLLLKNVNVMAENDKFKNKTKAEIINSLSQLQGPDNVIVLYLTCLDTLTNYSINDHEENKNIKEVYNSLHACYSLVNDNFKDKQKNKKIHDALKNEYLKFMYDKMSDALNKKVDIIVIDALNTWSKEFFDKELLLMKDNIAKKIKTKALINNRFAEYLGDAKKNNLFVQFLLVRLFGGKNNFKNENYAVDDAKKNEIKERLQLFDKNFNTNNDYYVQLKAKYTKPDELASIIKQHLIDYIAARKMLIDSGVNIKEQITSLLEDYFLTRVHGTEDADQQEKRFLRFFSDDLLTKLEDAVAQKRNITLQELFDENITEYLETQGIFVQEKNYWEKIKSWFERFENPNVKEDNIWSNVLWGGV